ncbi:hypothetical protein EV132_1245 [Rhizobium sullae]|uniref:Uncharacterized protein n=1 Tax=Rhizobium sullae TaxID=50338 RepID=A0A4R3PTH5_RHISU|nr:hypothetical protein EV132_1245 [Rhizobium sullae]
MPSSRLRHRAPAKSAFFRLLSARWFTRHCCCRSRCGRRSGRASNHPVVGDVGQSLAKRRFGRDTGVVVEKPSLHVGDQRRWPFLPPGKTSRRIKATQFGLNPIQLADPFEASSAIGAHELATGMRAAIGKLDVRAGAVRCNQPVVSGIADDLQDAREALRYTFGMGACRRRA